MIRRKILYILTLGATVWLVMLYTFQGLRFLLGLLLAIPILCLVPLLLHRCATAVELKELPSYVTRGEDIGLRVTVTHKSRIPLAGLRVRVAWRAYGEKPVKSRHMLRGVGGRGEKKIEFRFSGKHCGPGEFVVAKARIYDCLGLFSVPVKRDTAAKVLVTPVIMPIPEVEANVLAQPLKKRIPGNEGDYCVREFRQGDSLRSIHWKLTAKEDELRVKEFDMDADEYVKLFLHLTDDLLKDMEKRDAFLDRAGSIIIFLAESTESGGEVFWLEEGILRSRRVLEVEDAYLCIEEVLSVEKADETKVREDVIQLLMSRCHLEGDGRLYQGEQWIGE